MAKLNNHIFLRIKQHDYMQKDGCAHLNLHTCKRPYEVLERILVQLAAKNSVRWQDLLKARPNETNLYIELCVAIILIDRYLMDLFDMSERNRILLIGFEFTQIIDAYYAFLQGE